MKRKKVCGCLCSRFGKDLKTPENHSKRKIITQIFVSSVFNRYLCTIFQAKGEMRLSEDVVKTISIFLDERYYENSFSA